MTHMSDKPLTNKQKITILNRLADEFIDNHLWSKDFSDAFTIALERLKSA